MAELPRGTIREVRRGGAGVLELLLLDFEREGGAGYFKVEKPGSLDAVGQLVIKDGRPSLAIFEDEAMLMGAAALREIRVVAASDDSRISVHTGVDLELISDLHPEAKLHIHEEDFVTGKQMEGWIVDTKRDSDWWRQKQRSSWPKSEKAARVEAAEPAIDVQREIIHYSAGDELEAGTSYLIDEQTADSVLTIASHLAAIGHPLLVISREPPNTLASRFAIPTGCCRWLSERELEDVSTVHPGLESVRRICDQFLWSSSRAVIVLDGVEYLSGIHGFNSLMGMLRDLVDEVATSDHLVLIPADFDVWDERERTLIQREFDSVSTASVSEWSSRPAIIEGHPFCQAAPPQEIPAPRPSVSDAATDFKAAAQRILKQQSSQSQLGGGNTEREVVSPPTTATDLSATLTSAEMAAAAVEKPQQGEFSQPSTSFSARSLIDEMKRELVSDDEATPTAKDSDDTDGGSEEVRVTDPQIHEEFELPSWATAPSANMATNEVSKGEFPPSSVSSTPQPIPVKSSHQELDEEVSHPPSEMTDDFREELDKSVSEEASSELDEKGLRQPTIDHSPSKKRRIEPGRIPDILQFERQSTHYAAANSQVIEQDLVVPGWGAIDASVTSLSSKADEFREVGEWETPEERDWEVLETREMGAAVDNARILRMEPSTSEAATSARLSKRQWGSAIKSASSSGGRDNPPIATTEKPFARESALRSQRTKNLTESLASGEIAALYADRERMISGSGIGLEVLERISALSDRGHPIRGVVERIEADSKEGLVLLEEMEKMSVQVDDLIQRINVQQERGVIDGAVADRYRRHLIEFEQIGEISALLQDYER